MERIFAIVFLLAWCAIVWCSGMDYRADKQTCQEQSGTFVKKDNGEWLCLLEYRAYE
jgi:hypothetical protein